MMRFALSNRILLGSLQLGSFLWPLLFLPSLLVGDDVQYNRDVRPILAENCFACHGFDAAKREAGLRLDKREGAVAPLDSGEKAIVPNLPQESELVRRILSSDNDTLMPPAGSGKQLTPKQIQTLERWIEQGAKYDKHWSFIVPQKNEPPVVSVSGEDLSTLHPIDRFIRAKLAKEGLPVSPEANPITLMRRLSLDLTGLPPEPQDIDPFLIAFAKDSEQAYRDLVEKLLQSPHYGERWGRWWLDQARYADSNGYSIDAPRQIWKFRDWVVDAFNQDKPFDQFTIEQLAGDLLPNATDDQKIATGFHRNTQINQEGGIDPEQFRIDSVFDRVATTGTVWLGLTIGCAQCHTHKFDPIEHKEYYQLFAFLNNQEEPTLKVYPPEINATKLNEEVKQIEQELNDRVSKNGEVISTWEAKLTEESKKSLSKEIQKTLAIEKSKRKPPQLRSLYEIAAGDSDETYRESSNRLKAIEKKLQEAPTTLVMKELPKPRKSNLFIQGDFTRPADEVFPGTPAVLHPLENTTEQANRLDLAKWITSPNNPLTARVIVNRVWQQYFGRGIVETENDFGLQGAAPTHPELLDWLALQLLDQGWSMKKLHRMIVLSKTYRQSSSDRKDLLEKDPNNYLLARQRRLRLDAEIVRDIGLTSSGLLTRKMGGPPVYPPIPQGVMNQGQSKRDWNVSQGENRYRRGIYTFIFRSTPPPSLNVFDAPDGLNACTRRIRSNTPLQALTLLNDPAFFEFATALEKLIEKEGIESAFRRCTSRKPDREELSMLESLDRLSVARVLLNLDETVTRE